jgi:hypothetical protein
MVYVPDEIDKEIVRNETYGEIIKFLKDELSIQRTLAIKDCKNKELSNYQRGRIDALQEILKMIDP